MITKKRLIPHLDAVSNTNVLDTISVMSVISIIWTDVALQNAYSRYICNELSESSLKEQLRKSLYKYKYYICEDIVDKANLQRTVDCFALYFDMCQLFDDIVCYVVHNITTDEIGHCIE